MYTTIKKSIKEMHARHRARQHHSKVTKELDAMALTELGYPPKVVDKGRAPWFFFI